MTEYWVSQGNKWCEFCRIFIANNAVSIRSHELGLRHKNNVAKKVSKIQKDTINKEKETERATKELELIEAKAVRSYHNDIVESSTTLATPTLTSSKINECTTSGSQYIYSGASTVAQPSQIADAKLEWFKDSASGYQFNPATGHYFDPKSGFYYSDVLGKWTTEEEALKAAKLSKASGSTGKKPPPSVAEKPLVSGSSKPQVPVKGRPSAFAVTANNKKRKREWETRKRSNSAEEAQALAEREAARKRVQEREKSSLGLYQAY